MINPLAISHRADPASCRFAGTSNARLFFSLLAPAVRGFFPFNDDCGPTVGAGASRGTESVNATGQIAGQSSPFSFFVRRLMAEFVSMAQHSTHLHSI